MKKTLNIIFSGNFLYPQGLASTKRVQHFIDGVSSVEGSSVKVLLFRQAHPGRDDTCLQGVYQGVHYKTIGSDLTVGWRFPWAIFHYIVNGISFLLRNRKNCSENILYLFNEPNVEIFLFVIFARLVGYSVVVDVMEDSYSISNNASFFSRLKSASTQFFSRKISWFVDAIICISPFLKKKYDLIVKGEIPVFFIPVSADIGNVICLNSGFHQPIRILYAGSFAEKDDVESLMEAFERLCHRHTGIVLLLTGKGMKDRISSILEKIKHSPFAGKIHYLGFLSDVEYFKVLNSCDILCMVRVDSDYASRGFPFKLGEYLATGRPVLVSRVGDISDFLTDKKNAFFVEPSSVESIWGGLDYILTHEDESLVVGRAGRLVAEKYFNSTENSKKFLSVISRLVGI